MNGDGGAIVADQAVEEIKEAGGLAVDRGVKLRSSLPAMAEVSCSAPGYGWGRITQRKPMWLIPVSTICGRRAAGR
jgi:hypothetical protein